MSLLLNQCERKVELLLQRQQIMRRALIEIEDICDHPPPDGDFMLNVGLIANIVIKALDAVDAIQYDPSA